MNQQMRQWKAQQLFEKHSGQLAVDLALGVPRRHLDQQLAFLEYLLPDCGSSQLSAAYRVTLERLKGDVRKCPPVRLVK